MTRCRKVYLLTFALSLFQFGFSQDNHQTLRLRNGDFTPEANLANGSFQKSDFASSFYHNQYFVLLQFDRLPDVVSRKALLDLGVHLEGYLSSNTYWAVLPEQLDMALLKRFSVRSIVDLPVNFKIDQRLKNYIPSSQKNNGEFVAVVCSDQLSASVLKNSLQQCGAVWMKESERLASTSTLLVHADSNAINKMARLPFVQQISLQTILDQPLNYNSRAAHGVSGLNAINGRNLNGRGVTVGVGDDADISTHIDFSGRLISRTPWIPNDHGTHTSGTTAGAGIINVRNRGMASKAMIVNQFFSEVLYNAPFYVADYDMVTTNNSYFSVDAGCAGEGQYDVLSRFVDLQTNSYPQLLHVIAAGNDGSLTCSGYPTSFATVKSGWQSAKDVLTVGALNTADYTIAYFSSRGPLKDGRLKPEITAGGWNVVSTNANNTYGANFGTSMSCPAVTGSVALLYERYRHLNGNANPTGALVKALICNTAEDLGNAGPDFTFGFGMLNTRRAVEAMEANRYVEGSLNQGGSANHVIAVPANTRRLKVLLYWSDTAAATNAAQALVNDLDLTVTSPSSVLYRPLILNSTTIGVNNAAVQGIDRVNNIEQVVIDNPAGGNYSIQISGYAVPFGPQPYVVSYEMVQNGVTLEYPFGGETWVPGETEIIRWNAYGNDANTFTLEYSTDNGSSWSLINNNVAATSRLYSWTVPSTATNQALVRISRNGTAFADQSDFNFTVLGATTVTASNPCEGVVQLNWTAVTNANSYDVLQLTGDSMKVIGNTTGTSYLISGLDKNSRAWFGVAAKNGTVSGRRSISVSVLPNSGACTGAAFDNDVKVDSILEPISSRRFFSNQADANKPVKLQLRNLGNVAVAGPYTVSYSYNGTVVSEISNVSIPARSTLNYTFSTAYTPIAPGSQYAFKAWITKASDNNHLNDTAYKTVKYVSNAAITSLPILEGFETMGNNTFTVRELSIANHPYFDFSSNSTRGRGRSFVNTGFARTGIRAFTLDQSPYNNSTNVDTLTASYNLSNYTGSQLRFDFYYKNHGQAAAPGNYVWIRGSEGSAWIQAYDLHANQALLGGWKQARININDVFNRNLPLQGVSNTFQIRIGQEGNTSANSANPLQDYDDGYTIDDVKLVQAFNDIELVSILEPTQAGCSLTNNSPVRITIKNYEATALNNIQVNYQINGGAVVTETIPSINSNTQINYTFNQTANLAAYIDYRFKVWVNYSGDTYHDNDSIVDYLVHNSPVINIAGNNYLETFENNDGYFYTSGSNTSWEWGVPAAAKINKAPNGSKAWVTNLTGNYKDNETSYLFSPCYNISGGAPTFLTFSHFTDIELDYDYSWVEYSTNGINWIKLGTADPSYGTNWYDNAAANNWRLSNSKWHTASYPLPFGLTNVRFRWVLSTDGGVTQEGIGIDDVRLQTIDQPVTENHPILLIPYTGTIGPGDYGWTKLAVGDELMGPYYVSLELNPYGQDLGDYTITHAYNQTPSVRYSNGSYYLDKNILIKTQKNPTAPIGLRLYFRDAEVNDLLAATDCPTCAKPTDAYELGVTNYRGTNADENGILEDDSTGIFQFIPAQQFNTIPNYDGYYVEFNTASLGEFWFSAQPIAPPFNGTCGTGTYQFIAASAGSTYQWQINTGSGFVNIANNANYNGVTNDTLSITGLATSLTGSKFRCVVNGVNGPEITLRFKSVWMGTISNNWFTAANWSCGIVPDQYTDVYIPGGTAFNPVVNANTSVRSVTAKGGNSITVQPGVSFQVTGK